MQKTPARLRREQAKVDVARVLSRARTEADFDQQDIAQACGVAKQVPSVWESKAGPKSPWLVDVALMPSEVALPLVRWLASQHGYWVSAVSDQGADVGCVAGLQNLIRQCSEVTARQAALLATEEPDAGDLTALERLANEAADAMTRLAISARNRAAQLREAARPATVHRARFGGAR